MNTKKKKSFKFYHLQIHVDTSNAGTSCILVKPFLEKKRFIHFNSRVFDKTEQKMSNFHRRLRGIVSELQVSEHFNHGSQIQPTFFVIINLFCSSGNQRTTFLSVRPVPCFCHEVSNPNLSWTPGSGLDFTDFLSNNVTEEETENCK